MRLWKIYKTCPEIRKDIAQCYALRASAILLACIVLPLYCIAWVIAACGEWACIGLERLAQATIYEIENKANAIVRDANERVGIDEIKKRIGEDV